MSTDSKPKQFLQLFEDGNGGRISMAQRVWGQLKRAGLQDNTYICCQVAHLETIREQLGNVPVITEPSRRDTFAAVCLSTLFLTDVYGMSDDECIIFMPIDVYADDSYFQLVRNLETVLYESRANIVLMGVTPQEPTSKYGYIRVLPTNKPWFDVLAFVEKPREDIAKVLIYQGALWNCGVFCFRAGYIRQVLDVKGLPTTYEGLLDAFDSLSSRSFDYEVVEHERDVVAAVYSGSWKDLGTWESLSNHLGAEFMGSGTMRGCQGTNVINELDIPVVTLGLSNVIVVTTKDGILIANKSDTTGLKEVLA